MPFLERSRRTLVGVVHLPPTPGAPRFARDVAALLDHARRDARALAEGGCDALLVENFGDVPFFACEVPPETVATLALALDAVRAVAGGLPVGVNVLRNDARAALGLCAATGAAFLRVNVHCGAAVTDQGLLQGRAAETLRERARLCPAARILADVHVKHGRPLADQPLAEAARDALLRGLADALIASGVATGSPPQERELALLRDAVGEAPLLIGSGVDAANAAALLRHADGAIVGTSLKRGGEVRAPVERERVARLRAAFDALGPAPWGR